MSAAGVPRVTEDRECSGNRSGRRGAGSPLYSQRIRKIGGHDYDVDRNEHAEENARDHRADAVGLNEYMTIKLHVHDLHPLARILLSGRGEYPFPGSVFFLVPWLRSTKGCDALVDQHGVFRSGIVPRTKEHRRLTARCSAAPGDGAAG